MIDNPATLEPGTSAFLQLLNGAALEPWNLGTWNFGTPQAWNSGTLEPLNGEAKPKALNP